MILPIKHTAYWELIRQKNQAKINKDSIHKNSKIVDHGYKVRDKLILDTNAAFRYETTYKYSFDMTQYCTDGMVTPQFSSIKVGTIYIASSHIHLI